MVRLSEIQVERQSLRNALHAAILLLLMAGMFMLVGSWFFGPAGSLLLGLAAMAGLVWSAARTPRLVLAFYGARRLLPEEAPALHNTVRLLANWARLEQAPALYYIPSAMQNAFAVGLGPRAAIAVTDGLIRNFPMRELAGILAHEVSHIKNHDTFVLGLADGFGRLTSLLANAALVLLLLLFPLALADAQPFPVLWVLLLNLFPLASSLLILALSRTREFQADLQAAVITGDPRGLIAALTRLERQNAGFFQRWFPRRSSRPEPSLLRTHPPTEERIRRLREIEEEQTIPILHLTEANALPFFPLHYKIHKPRWHVGGCWW